MVGLSKCFAQIHGPVLLGLMLLNTALLACSDGSSSTIDTRVLRYSAGIQIAESPYPVWSDAETWVVNSVPTVRIGGEVDDSVPLVGVVRARVLADSRIVVANGRKGINEVLMFDSLGHFEQAIGGAGEGPDEFRRVDDLYRCAGDTQVVNGFSRVSSFDAQGKHVRTTDVRQIGGSGRRWIRGITADCATWLVQTYTEEPSWIGSVGVRHTTLMWSQLDQSSSDTIVSVPGLKLYNRWYPEWENPEVLVIVPWGQLSSWTLGRTRAYVGISDRPEVRVFGSDGGLVQIIRWAEPATRISTSDRRRFAEKRARWLPKFPQVHAIIPPIGEYPEIPNNKPLFSALVRDDDGNLWVGGYPDFIVGLPIYYEVGRQLWEREGVNDEIRAWKVFDGDGRLLGAVDIPARLYVLAIERGYVITLSTGKNDVEVVELYGLDKRTED